MVFELIADERTVRAANELSGKFGFTVARGGTKVFVREGETFACAFSQGAFTITVQKRVQIFLALKRISDELGGRAPEEGYSFEAHCSFRELSFMLDCSRNAVAKTETLFELVRHLAVMGYDSLGLYMEDTFVVKNQPYFGFFRTPYTAEDIRAVDEYCALFGVELVPYIQTLAHFNTLTRHYALGHLFDVNDILLAGEESTYSFIEDLISTCASCFSTRRIHIGMDEAYMLGRGKYMDKNGAKPRFEIMSAHLKRVNDICKKYGLKPAMWSDMFFALTATAQFAQYGNELPREVLEGVPRDIELIYWDYCETKEEVYAERMRHHRAFPNEIGFASGAWKWLGYTPDNRYSFDSCAASARACLQNGIRDYIVTGWGDNGAECSPFAVLPALHYCSRFNYGDFERGDAFKTSFESLAGMPFDAFMTIDLCNRVTDHDDVEEKNSANKYLLFNDVLLGTLDTTLDDGTGKLYAEHAKALAKAKRKAGKWGYLFETQYRLALVLELKAEMGVWLRRAYGQNDKRELADLVSKLHLLLFRIESFYRAHGKQWHIENRANGFDVQDIRIGALKQRVKVAAEKVSAYLKGEADSVPELEEEMLDFMGHNKEFEKDYDQCEWRWRRMTSVNMNE